MQEQLSRAASCARYCNVLAQQYLAESKLECQWERRQRLAAASKWQARAARFAATARRLRAKLSGIAQRRSEYAA